MTSLGGPREGMCRARQFTVVRDTRDDFETRDARDLGTLPWAELIGMVEDAGGTRPTFDLFDLPPDPDGSWTRIRAVSEGYQP
jgi:hypothetical protein